MPDRDLEPDALDRWLRGGLEPDPEASQRLARQALTAAPGSGTRGSGVRPGRWAALGTATLVVAVVGLIWSRGDSTPQADQRSIQITNHGELVAAVDPAGGAWLHAPIQVVDDSAPRFVIIIGGTDAN